MKQFAFLALIGQISAIKFVAGEFEDDDLVNSDKQDQFNKNHKQEVSQPPLMASQIKSDPIFDSTRYGDESKQYDFLSPEMAEEVRLQSLKPRTWELDEDEHPATMDSLKWAEKKLDHQMVIPHLDPVPLQEGGEKYNAIFDYTDDEDVSGTLKSAHQAEMIYGLHNAYSYGGYGNNNSTSGNYGYYNTPAGLNGEVEHPRYQSYIPSFGGNSTHNAYDKKYGDPEPAQNGYSRNGYGHQGARDNANKDWYNNMVKDQDNWGDGMHSNKVGIMDPAHGHFSGSKFSGMTKEAIEEVGRQIIAKQQRTKMNPEDIAAAKAVKEVLGIYDPNDKKEGEENKEEGKSADAPPAAAPASEEIPPELSPEAAPAAAPAGLTQQTPQSAPAYVPTPAPVATPAAADQGQALTTMMIDGQKVAIPQENQGDSTNADLLDQDLVQLE